MCINRLTCMRDDSIFVQADLKTPSLHPSWGSVSLVVAEEFEASHDCQCLETLEVRITSNKSISRETLLQL